VVEGECPTPCKKGAGIVLVAMPGNYVRMAMSRGGVRLPLRQTKRLACVTLGLTYDRTNDFKVGLFNVQQKTDA